MVSDSELAQALAQMTALEARARAHWKTAPEFAERDAALTVVRHVTAAQQAIEKWIAGRSRRSFVGQ